MNGIDCTKSAYPLDTVSFNAKIYSKDSSLLHFEWDFNGDGIVDTSVDEPNCKFIYKKAGIFSVRMNVIYNTQIIGTDSSIITIVPFNLSLKTNPDTIAPLKSTIHLSASASGSPDSLYKYEWSIDGSPFVSVSRNDTIIKLPNTYRKDYMCKCRVTDVFGSTTVDTVNIEVGIWTVIDSIGHVGEGYYGIDAATDGKQIAFNYLTNSVEVAFYDSSFHRTIVKSSWYQDSRLIFSHNKFLLSFCDLKFDVALCAYEYNGAGWNNLSEKTFLNEKNNYSSGIFYLNDKLTITSIQFNHQINFFTLDDYK